MKLFALLTVVIVLSVSAVACSLFMVECVGRVVSSDVTAVIGVGEVVAAADFANNEVLLVAVQGVQYEIEGPSSISVDWWICKTDSVENVEFLEDVVRSGSMQNVQNIAIEQFEIPWSARDSTAIYIYNHDIPFNRSLNPENVALYKGNRSAREMQETGYVGLVPLSYVE